MFFNNLDINYSIINLNKKIHYHSGNRFCKKFNFKIFLTIIIFLISSNIFHANSSTIYESDAACKNISHSDTKIINLLRKAKLLKNQYFKINIKKNIPHGSGLGGGSSNASNLLNYLNTKMKLRLKGKQIINLAKKIGFDVPISLERKNTFFIVFLSLSIPAQNLPKKRIVSLGPLIFDIDIMSCISQKVINEDIWW